MSRYDDFEGLSPMETLVFHLVVTPLVIGVSILKLLRGKKRR